MLTTACSREVMPFERAGAHVYGVDSIAFGKRSLHFFTTNVMYLVSDKVHNIQRQANCFPAKL